jgi:hypothetical protein
MNQEDRDRILQLVAYVKNMNYQIDILPTAKAGGFWIQTAIANKVGLTSPSPCVDAPTQ